MRTNDFSNKLRLSAIAGTYVVILGFDLNETHCEGLLGFSILRKDLIDDTAIYLNGMKCFEQTDPGFPKGSLYPSNAHPIQSFQWADYAALPGRDYIYVVTALKGKPSKLTQFSKAEVEISTESPETGKHDVYFNRGTAASQEYVRRFGNKAPHKTSVPYATYQWLSRGAEEALMSFVNLCKPNKDKLRIAAYEFRYEPLVELIAKKIDEGVDIKIIYDARKNFPRDENRSLVRKYNLEQHCIERTENVSYISHNKFIIKIRNGLPMEVLTGGMNFSEGGIYGQSNVLHIVQDERTAEQYLNYRNILKENKQNRLLCSIIERELPLGDTSVLPEQGISTVFSPRKTLTALEFYAKLAVDAKDGVFMTFAFGINDVLKDVYVHGQSSIRYALLDKKTRSFKDKADKIKEEKRIDQLRFRRENIFAIGNFVRTNKLDGWVKEKLTGLNSHVNYIHNKFMILDPLSEDPIVICGSANFSSASTKNNDENMVIIRGDKRVSDIYLGEYMRLFSHFSFRESLQWRKDSNPPKPLKINDWWKSYYKKGDRKNRREFFCRQF